jgi:hypothetical protein
VHSLRPQVRRRHLRERPLFGRVGVQADYSDSE